ncbi:MAG: SLC13 family permease [Phycisphaerales bacterium]
MLPYEAWCVLAVLVIVLLMLAKSRLPADAILVGGLTLLMVLPGRRDGTWQIGGILTPEEGLSGLANPGVVTIGVLFAVVAGLRETGAIDTIGGRLLGRPRKLRGALVRVTLPVSALSAFLNNTPVVAMLIPAIIDWSRQRGFAASRLLMPLSFAAILGGTCSLIGTSTNLVVAGLVQKNIQSARATLESIDAAVPAATDGSAASGAVPAPTPGAGAVPPGVAPPASAAPTSAAPANAGVRAPAISAEDEAVARTLGDMKPLTMFGITLIGFPCLVLGTAYVWILAPKLLPDNGGSARTLGDPREYVAEMVVPRASPLIGRTIEAAGLRHLPGCYLVEIERAGALIPAVGPEEVLQAGDHLVFTGIVESIRDLAKLRGLELPSDQVFKLEGPRHARCLFEAVVSNTFPGIGRTVREGRFRSRYDAVIIAVARNGRRLKGKIGDIRLQPGDTLLIESQPSFGGRHRDSRDFFLVSTIENSTPPRHAKAPIAMGLLVLMVVLAAAQWMSMLQASMLTAGLMLFTRCCSLRSVRSAVDWSLLVVIAAALGIGAAMKSTGLAAAVADGLTAAAGGNPWLALLAVYVATNLLTELVTNNAAVVLMFPVAMVTASQLDVSAMPFVMSIMMAGSASFSTPLGYQTNLMVFGPGGYRFSDYLRFGLPMNILVCLVTVGLAPLIWSF